MRLIECGSTGGSLPSPLFPCSLFVATLFLHLHSPVYDQALGQKTCFPKLYHDFYHNPILSFGKNVL